MTDLQLEEKGKLRVVQLIPSVDEAAWKKEGLVAMATKIPVVGLTVTDRQNEVEGKVRMVQLVPLVDEAA